MYKIEVYNNCYTLGIGLYKIGNMVISVALLGIFYTTNFTTKKIVDDSNRVCGDESEVILNTILLHSIARSKGVLSSKII